MLAADRPRREVVRLWSGVAVVCAAACVAGYALADVTGARFAGIVDGFAAGALLVMLAGVDVPRGAREGRALRRARGRARLRGRGGPLVALVSGPRQWMSALSAISTPPMTPTARACRSELSTLLPASRPAANP